MSPMNVKLTNWLDHEHLKIKLTPMLYINKPALKILMYLQFKTKLKSITINI